MMKQKILAKGQIVSLVWFITIWEKYRHSEKEVYLHADNCTAQNKNNASIQYLMCCVKTLKNEKY